jgi:Cu/Ag efflux pump CusA
MTGTKGSLALKIFGDDLKLLEQKGEEVTNVMSGIRACMTSSSCATSASPIST